MSNVLSNLNQKLMKNIDFINISYKNDTIFEIRPNNSKKCYVLDLCLIRNNLVKNIYFHLEKSDNKFVYVKRNNLIYTIISNVEIQYQILETILEMTHDLFHDTFDVDFILSFESISESYFKPFKEILNKQLIEFSDLDLIENVLVYCKVCSKSLPLFIKKNEITNSDSFPVPIIYKHNGHSIICYIDKNFKVRGTKLVKITG